MLITKQTFTKMMQLVIFTYYITTISIFASCEPVAVPTWCGANVNYYYYIISGTTWLVSDNVSQNFAKGNANILYYTTNVANGNTFILSLNEKYLFALQ